MERNPWRERWFARYWAPWCTLVVALLLTGVATAYVSATTHRIDEMRFRRWVENTTDDIRSRLDKYVTLLEGVAALFNGSELVSRQDFEAYIRRLGLSERYPGIQGVGFTLRLPPGPLDAVERRLSEVRGEPFRIWPKTDRPDRHTILFLEPEDFRNREAIGYDMSSEETRRLAMEAARDSGRPTASGRVTLVQEVTEDKQAGLLIYVPVYGVAGVPETVEQRRASLLGFAYGPFRAADLLQQITDTLTGALIDVQVYDGPVASPESLLYSSPLDPAADPHFTATRSVTVADRTWTIVFASRPAFEQVLFANDIVGATLLGGVLVSLTLFGITLAQSHAQKRAEQAARRAHHSELALRESDQRLRLALEASEQFAFILDVESGDMTIVGDAERILGSAPATSTQFRERVHPEDRLRFEASLDRAIVGEAEHAIEFRILRPDGQIRWVRDRAVAELDEEGRPRRMVGMVADVTRQKEIEREMRSLNETLEQRVAERTVESEERSAQLRALAGELTIAEQRERRRLAQVLHDHLQQLLVAVMIRMGSLRRKSADDAQRQSLSQVDDLLRQAIDASRSLTVELSPPVLYDAGLGRGLEWLGRSMQEKYGLGVDVNYQREAEPQSEDMRAFLFQAVRELLFNVVKHAGVGRAAVSLRRIDDQQVQITVEDEGPGFDPAVLRVKGAKAEHFGLFSIQQRLEMLGGRMDLRSRPGEGTRIALTVPVEFAQRPVVPRRRSEGDGHAAGTADPLPKSDGVAKEGAIRVLLADDHELLREGLGTVLESQPDIEVVGEASDGAEAVDLARRLRPDVVVMDVTMPRLDGVEATRQIKAEHPQTRVIGLSMHDQLDLADAMRHAGAIAYLNKTGPTDELLGLIRRL